MTSGRRGALRLAIVLAIACGWPDRIHAHAGLRFSSPLDGATLGESPSHVQLTFAERPEISLTTIRVVDTNGVSYQGDRLEEVEGDPLSLLIRVRSLPKGIYVVHWRVVSAVDGHASAGVFVFGVMVDPSGAAVAATKAAGETSAVEVAARALLLLGLVIALGAAAASIGGFGSGREFVPAVTGWAMAIAGLTLLIGAQAGVADAGLLPFFRSVIGRALAWRAAALVALGAALALVRSVRQHQPRLARAAMWGVALAAMAAIVAHSAAGHAAAARWPIVPTVSFQAVHFIAAGAWIGGLAALLWSFGAGASDKQTLSIRRFSQLAGAGLAIVVIAGVARAVQELTTAADLIATDYGRVVSIKVVLLVVIAGLGAVNRWRSLRVVETDLRPLRRIASLELVLAALAVMAAALLGTLPPPAGSGAVAGITVSGADFATTVRATLNVASNLAGPNRFAVRVHDYDSREPVAADRVSLRFTPLDDPAVPPSPLSLTRQPDESFAGAGANLAFDGRWKVDVLIERGATSTDVPLEIETRDPPLFVSTLRPPGENPTYTIEVRPLGHIQITAQPERPGPSTLLIRVLTGIYEPHPVEHIVVTTGAGSAVRQLPAQRQDRNQFLVPITLERGSNRIVVVARMPDGTRLRAYVTIDVR